ncbi:HNH endonuclease signature motif containing protein [Nitrosospira sp. Nsp13]|uniref:HNH endonuclease n=1 Tax=Nitrosospira sp. Nsp13 TaxID=1855332 RepID=UPI00088B6F79|nr:HNH endonuclease signature motif containing protein [Nitrosospira sp. Nsp13]SCX87342.1 5-methylcytosine-specific restriction enzyme A [Nitrosospira sp. Nsp13]
MNDEWNDEELKASVQAYVEMQRDERLGQPFIKKHYYKRLAEVFGRSEKAYEYRMQNISYVLALMGRSWVTGLKPARNIDGAVAAQIEKFLWEVQSQKAIPVAAFKIAVRDELKQKTPAIPSGNAKPKSRRVTVTQFRCNAPVTAWVLQQADGMCECCEKAAPFKNVDGLPHLELHYMRQLADGGQDVISNAVALCPNCHREIHHGASAHALVAWLYDNVGRLIPE